MPRRDSATTSENRPVNRRPLSRHLLAPREMRIPITEIERELYERFRGRYRKIHRLKVRERELCLVGAFCVILGGKVINHFASHLPQPVFDSLMTLSVTLPLAGLTWAISRRERRLRCRALRYAGVPECRRCGRLVASDAARCGFCKLEREVKARAH
jgi:hypothetical protein